MEFSAVDHAQLACTGVRHHHVLAVRRDRHPPRIGRTEIHIIQECRVDIRARLAVKNAEPRRVHPAAFKLGRRKLIAPEGVSDIDVFSVR